MQVRVTYAYVQVSWRPAIGSLAWFPPSVSAYDVVEVLTWRDD